MFILEEPLRRSLGLLNDVIRNPLDLISGTGNRLTHYTLLSDLKSVGTKGVDSSLRQPI